MKEHQSPSMIATQNYANKVMKKINPLRRGKSRDIKIENSSVESNGSSIGLPLRSYDNAVSQRKQVLSVHQPSNDLGKEEVRPLVLQNGERGVDQRSSPAPLPSAKGSSHFPELECELRRDAKHDSRMIRASQPSRFCAYGDNDLNGGEDDKSLLSDNIGLTVEGFVDKYQFDSDVDNLCKEESNDDFRFEDNETMDDVNVSGSRMQTSCSGDNTPSGMSRIELDNSSRWESTEA